MRYLDWRTLSSIGYVVGAVALLLGIYTYVYYETNLIGEIGLTFEHYQKYAIPLMIVGFALLSVGYVTEHQARKKIKSAEKKQETASTAVCPSCGANRDSDALYCKKCGKKFE